MLDNIFEFLGLAESKKKIETKLHCYCLGLDVVEYSKRTTDVQAAIIDKINNAILKSIALRDIERENLIFLPTGDGVIICLLGTYSNPLVLIQLARELHKYLKEEYEKFDEEERFAVRIGLHSGTGALITDINGRRNIAGAVVNMTQRIMDKGDDWHILASKNAFDDIATMDKNVRKDFYSLGFGEVKHKITIEFYNVFCCSADPYGNENRPTGILQAYTKVETGSETPTE